MPDTQGDQIMVSAGWEEFYDYVFPDDERNGQGKSIKNLKLLEMAHKWKKTEAGAP